MRPIDADSLMRRLQKKKSTFFDRKQTEGFNDAIMRVRSMVHSEKTVDPESLPIVQQLRKQLADVRPVAYGEWASLGGDEWCCTNCGHVISTEGSWERPCKKYCEECGADMRGKPNKEE